MQVSSCPALTVPLAEQDTALAVTEPDVSGLTALYCTLAGNWLYTTKVLPVATVPRLVRVRL